MDPSTPPPPAPTDPVPVSPPLLAARPIANGSALRTGVVIGAALVVVLGTVVAMGASRGPSTSGAGQVAAASGSPAPSKGPRGNGFGHGGFGNGVGPLGGLPERIDKAFGRGFGRVTITAIDGSKLSLATVDGWTRTITLTPTTTISRGGAAATASALHVGDTIRFRQQREADGSFTITAVDVVLPQVVGTITKVDGTTLTLTARDGATVTVHLGGSTRIQVGGIANATAKDLAAGQVVIVVGEKRSDGSIDATAVASGRLRGPKLDKKDRVPAGSAAPAASGQAG